MHLLFEVASEAITSWCLENGFLPGISLIMHTFGSILNFDPHMHMLITEGGMSTVNGSWRSCNYFPHEMLKSRFRTLLIKRLRALAKDNLLSIPDDLRKIWLEKYNFWGNFYALTKKLYDYIWYVHIGKKLENAYFTVRYIGRYAKRPSIAETRILYYSFEEQIVVFQYRDKHTDTVKTTTLSVEEFISRLIRHIPEKHFRMIRYSGLYANRMKTFYTALLANIIIDLFGIANLQFDPNDGNRYKNWRERIMASAGDDPLVCPVCNEPMVLVEIAYRARDGPLKTIIL